MCVWPRFPPLILGLHLNQEMVVISFADACILSMLFNLSCSTQLPLVVHESHFRSWSNCKYCHLVIYFDTRIPCSSSSSILLYIPIWIEPTSIYGLYLLQFLESSSKVLCLQICSSVQLLKFFFLAYLHGDHLVTSDRIVT